MCLAHRVRAAHWRGMHSHDRATEELTGGDRPLRRRSDAARPATARPAQHAARSSATRPARRSPPRGIGGLEALRVFEDVLAPACISVDHPRFLSFVPAAPTEASILFDLVVGASSIYAGSWLEGAGAVFAENEALRWIADLAGLPATAGGVFVSGGTAGNLSALIAARWRWRHRADGRHDRTRGLMIASTGAHSSIVAGGPGDGRRRRRRTRRRPRRMAGGALRGHRRRARRPTTATGSSPSSPRRGTTNAGVIDDLAGAADVCGRARHLVPRRRRLRRRRARRAERPPPLRRDRARRQLHRRSAQVAVRAVRLLRAAVPRPATSPARPTRNTPSTSTCSTPTTRPTSRGTRATTPTTCRAAPAACRSGSASPRTAPTPTATRSRRRSPTTRAAARLIDDCAGTSSC